ncbi:MAG TPA: hypothetical protein VK171_06945 [Fimbriimonas sp.]|nr:hypothetical protein [Fimbriimonas sp.]
MKTKRGATLVEVIFTLSLASTVLASIATLTSYVLIRTGDSVTQFNTINDATSVVDAIANTATNAMVCATVPVGSVNAIKCTMPEDGTDVDGDGILDSYLPDKVYKSLQETYVAGKRVWYFPSTKPAAIGTPGRYWYRAIKSNDATPISSDIDAKWTLTPRYVAGGIRFNHVVASNLTRIICDTSGSSDLPDGYVGTKATEVPILTFIRIVKWHHAR